MTSPHSSVGCEDRGLNPDVVDSRRTMFINFSKIFLLQTSFTFTKDSQNIASALIYKHNTSTSASKFEGPSTTPSWVEIVYLFFRWTMVLIDFIKNHIYLPSHLDFFLNQCNKGRLVPTRLTKNLNSKYKGLKIYKK